MDIEPANDARRLLVRIIVDDRAGDDEILSLTTGGEVGS